MNANNRTRRYLLGAMALLPWLTTAAMTSRMRRRVRPTDAAWPSANEWQDLNQAVGGRLLKVHSPLAECLRPSSGACAQVLAELHNPYYIGDEPGLTQTLGWVDAWSFAPSAYAVAAKTSNDVVAAINFARQKNLRVVIKGGGHSYQGTSNAADSLLVWTRPMQSIAVHDAFVPSGCASAAVPAVSVEAGALWMQVYDVVTTHHGRYVQGGGCTTVGVAGLVQSGGFGSFSKRYGSAAGSLLEAEIVTADGELRIANACTNPDLFWGIKGGGGGSLGVVTRVTLETHELPALFGLVRANIRANSDAAFRKLIGSVLSFYREHLFNPNWGEQIIFKANRTLSIQMLSQGLEHGAASGIWSGFFDAIGNAPDDFTFLEKPSIADFPARSIWDPKFLAKLPGIVQHDERPDADSGNLYWSGDAAQCGQVLHGYDSVWLPAALLDESHLQAFADALYAAANQWELSLHFNKGLAGAPPSALDAARNTAMHPAVLEAFALAILGAEEPPAYPGIVGHEPNAAQARRDAKAIERAMAELRKVVPNPAAYVSESNFFEKEWQRAFWGSNYPRLRTVKSKYDPHGLLFVHHGVGSEGWSADGFTYLG